MRKGDEGTQLVCCLLKTKCQDKLLKMEKSSETAGGDLVKSVKLMVNEHDYFEGQMSNIIIVNNTKLDLTLVRLLLNSLIISSTTVINTKNRHYGPN